MPASLWPLSPVQTKSVALWCSLIFFFLFNKIQSTLCYIRNSRRNRWMPLGILTPVCVSEQVVSCTRKWTPTISLYSVLSLYSFNFQYDSESHHLPKYSDECAVVGCLISRQEADCCFVAWCGNNTSSLLWTREGRWWWILRGTGLIGGWSMLCNNICLPKSGTLRDEFSHSLKLHVRSTRTAANVTDLLGGSIFFYVFAATTSSSL